GLRPAFAARHLLPRDRKTAPESAIFHALHPTSASLSSRRATKAVTPDTSPVATESAKEGEDEYQLIIRVLKETNGVVAGPKGAA
ncbi:hypothetical protein MJN51_34170, partial [Salmonella enterica subsp. enterica serovar Kentucky]|nr:hypothetical protein [Salmonella enterica subsp. enterica serovar Kentucky]